MAGAIRHSPTAVIKGTPKPSRSWNTEVRNQATSMVTHLEMDRNQASSMVTHLEMDRLGDLGGMEEEEAEQELIWHAGDERVLAHEGGHDGLCGHHSDPLLEQNLLESARVVVGMAMCKDHMRHLRVIKRNQA